MKLAEIMEQPEVHHEPLDMTPWKLPGAEIALNDVQRRALSAVVSAQGGFFPIGVGHGKTFIALLAGTVLGRDSVVFAPPHTVSQMAGELERLRKSFRIDRAVEVVPYSQISMADGRERIAKRLSHLDPQNICVVLDEAHAIKNTKSARARRVVDLCRLLKCPVVALSGTMTNRYLSDFAHIAKMSVSPCFLPRDRDEMHALHTVLDNPEEYDRAYHPSFKGEEGFRALMGASSAQVKSTMRERMQSWRGVQATSSTSVGASLRLTAPPLHVSDAIWQALSDAETYVYPNGQEAVEPVEVWRLCRTLSSGWWYELIWSPELPPDFFVARKRFWGTVRAMVDAGTFESPSLCVRAMQMKAATDSDHYLGRLWLEWEPWADHPKPERRAHVIDTSIIEQVGAHVKKGDPCIVWYHYVTTADLLEKHCGIKVWRAGEEPVRQPHLCAMSIPSHGEGLNLQQWGKSLVLEPPTTGKAWEQMLGRLHRVGTPHDEIWFEVAQATKSQKNAYFSALRDARYVEAVMGQQQKLCLTRLVD